MLLCLRDADFNLVVFTEGVLPFHKFCVILGPEKLVISILSQSVFLGDDGGLKGTSPNYKTLQNSQTLMVFLIPKHTALSTGRISIK